MNIPEKDLSGAPWTKSSRSGDASNCVEVVAIDVQSTSQGA
jgi:hypothetical protein